MNKHSHKSILLIAFIVSVFLGITSTAQAQESAIKPQAYGVLFYADWCGSCKILEPKIQEARQSLKDSPILFLTLDMTDEVTKYQAAMLAGTVGLDSLYAENAGKTGYMLIIDANTRKVIGKLTKGDAVETIAAKLKDSTQG
ncbi:MAG: hypothetical protein GC138_03230 [Gammaproteobacteria bacterium]|nr:hypothetical protein [Gammaproteobacteria bacterium]